jgi:2-dehydro-3-deoxyphosphogluconate aldolase/(4S)-4-hydroxy-2-oxoglutarate aldolase
MSQNVISEKRIVPVVVIHDVEHAMPLAEALLEGGLNVMEITLRTPASEPALEKIARSLPQMVIGAGTLLEPQQVLRAKNVGAQFGVAPGLNSHVLTEARRIGLPFIPGVMTPSEVEAAVAAGCKLLKYFPANLAGGVPMLKALSGPYLHTGARFIALGGITTANMSEYLDVPIVADVGGSWIVEPSLLAARNWTEVTQRARDALAAVAAARKQ